MLRLDIKHQPYDVDLGTGVTVHVRPYDNLIRLQAVKYLNEKMIDLSAQYKNCKEADLPLDHLPDMENDQVRNNMSEHFFTIGRALAGIISWQGPIIDDKGTPAPVDEKWISKMFMQFPTLQDNFHRQYMGVQELMAAEKKDLGTAPDISSDVVPNIAKAVKPTKRRVVKAKKGKRENTAPK